LEKNEKERVKDRFLISFFHIRLAEISRDFYIKKKKIKKDLIS
jgi:hypothetical protein